MKESYTYLEMEELIKCGEVEIIKKSERFNSKNIKRMLIKIEDVMYLTCSHCGMYLTLDNFGNSNISTFANKHNYCFQCRNNKERNNYSTNFEKHLYHRYFSLKVHTDKYKSICLSYEQFKDFAETVKEPMFNLTLKEAFDLGLGNQFEIEHKIALFNGGTSLSENLFLSHKSFNRLKGTMSVEETIEFAKLIVKNEDKIKESYNM